MKKGERIIREAERFNRTGVPRGTWRRHEKAGTVPKSVPLLGDTRGWVLSEIEAWIRERIESAKASAQHSTSDQGQEAA